MLEGEISEMNLIERLVELWREQFTGAIRFESDGIIKIIYFKGGDVLSASTNDRADSIDEILMKAGKVSREHVKQALARRKENETLGDAMLNLGYITRKELTWARRVQVVGVIRSIDAWKEGSFTIVADYLPKRDEGTLFPLPQVLVELIVTEQDRQKFDRALDGGAAVLEQTRDFPEVFNRLGLNEDADAIVAQVDGLRTAAEVASASGRDAFNVYKLLQALVTLGILSRKAQVKHELSIDDDFAAAGLADASEMWTDVSAAEAPRFEFDEAAAGGPTLEVPKMSFDLDDAPAPVEPPPPAPPVVSPASAAASAAAWVEEEEEEDTVLPTARMPAWDVPPPAAAAPIPARVERPADANEKQWGFDEAQIETARRGAPGMKAAARPPLSGAVPARKQAPPRKRTGLWVAILLIVLLGGGAYAGFLWWQKQQDAALEPAAGAQKAPAVRTPVTAPQATGTIVEIPAPTTTTAPVTDTATTSTPVTSTPVTSAPAPAPLRISPPPDTATSTSAAAEPLPVVTPRAATGTTRDRYDERARLYAANPQGNFTVQIQILCDPANLDKAVRAGGANVWYVPQALGARSCYRVFWGRYDTREEAQRALATVPASLRDRSSAVQPVPK